MEGFRESAVYMTELAMSPAGPSSRHSRHTPIRRRPATRDSTCTYSTFSSIPHSRNISIEPLYRRLPKRESFTAPGSVSPRSASQTASSNTSFTRGRSLSRRLSSNSSACASQSSASCEPIPKPPSLSRWLSDSSRQTSEQAHSKDSDSERSISPPGSSTFRSGVARPVRVHRFSMPGSVHSRSDSSLSFDTVRTIDTTSPATSPNLIGTEPSPMVYSCEFAKAIKMVRVCVPAGPPVASQMTFNEAGVDDDLTPSDSSNSQGLGLSLRTISSCASLTISSGNSTDMDADEPTTPGHLELPVFGMTRVGPKKQVRHQKSTTSTTQSLLPRTLTPSESLLSPSQVLTKSHQSTSLSSNSWTSLATSGRATTEVARPATSLSVLNEIECRGRMADDDCHTTSSFSIMSENSSNRPQYDQQTKKRWRWMSKARTKSRHFIGLLAESN